MINPVNKLTMVKATVRYHLDLDRYRLCSGEKSFLLTRTEASILDYLMRFPGHVKSRKQILDACWLDGGIVFDRRVDTAIKRIRQKARETFGEFEAIHNLYGIGYTFEETL